jgi:hypothetical protein
MSSLRAGAAKAPRRAKAAAHAPAGPAAAKRPSPAAKPARRQAARKSVNDGNERARQLATELEAALAGGRRDALSADALQSLMAAVCKTYAAQIEAGGQLLPLPAHGGASATDVMITASGLLKAANLAVFELGMWQSWTGR